MFVVMSNIPVNSLNESVFDNFNGDIMYRACVGINGGYDQKTVYDGFCEAVDVMLGYIKDKKACYASDTLVYPVMFCVRHAIELFFKNVLPSLRLMSWADNNLKKYNKLLKLKWRIQLLDTAQKNLSEDLSNRCNTLKNKLQSDCKEYDDELGKYIAQQFRIHDLNELLLKIQYTNCKDGELCNLFKCITQSNLFQTCLNFDAKGDAFRYSADENQKNHFVKNNTQIVALDIVGKQFKHIMVIFEKIELRIIYLLKEYNTGTYTKHLSRSDIENISHMLPQKEKFPQELKSCKEKIKKIYGIGSKEFDDMLKIIKNNREFSANIGKEIVFRQLTDGAITFFAKCASGKADWEDAKDNISHDEALILYIYFVMAGGRGCVYFSEDLWHIFFLEKLTLSFEGVLNEFNPAKMFRYIIKGMKRCGQITYMHKLQKAYNVCVQSNYIPKVGEVISMDFVVWGAGTQGKRFAKFIKEHSQHNIKAFIDICADDIEKSGFDYPVVTYDVYKERYFCLPIVICMANKLERDSIKAFLEEENVLHFSYCDCAGEMFFLACPMFPLKEMLALKNVYYTHIGVYGDNLFSVVLYDYLRSRGVSVKLAYSTLSSAYKYFSDKGYECEDVKSLVSQDYLILHTEEGYKKEDLNNLPFNDFIKLPMYKNSMLGRFKNMYKAHKRCFIVATGPSLRMEDLEKLHRHNELCISMNKVYLAFAQTEWRPDFLVVIDPFVLDANVDDLMSADVKYKLFGDATSIFWYEVEPNENNVFKLHVDRRDYVKKMPGFSNNLMWGVYDGRTVTYACLQLAMYLGVSEIYLLGLDFSYKKYEDDDKNHFIKGYSATNIVPPNGIGSCMLQHNAYQKAKQVADEAGVKIYNASRYTELDVFERVDFDSLFD